MVYFTCNHCGEALKKQVVEKHSFRCNRNIFVSCMDCFKDFKANEYDLHTTCVTEMERYSGKGYVPKANQNKGAKKQEAWVETVRNIQASKKNIAQSVNNILNQISKHDNIPRKKASFIRFLQNSFRYMKMNDIEAAWGLLEEEMVRSKTQQNGSNPNGSNGVIQNGKSVESEANSHNYENGSSNSTKKRKADTNNCSEGAKIAKVELSGNFEWTATIKDIVLSKNNQIQLKKLKKKVFKRYKTFYDVSAMTEKFEKKFTKCLKKMGLVMEDDTVRLIE